MDVFYEARNEKLYIETRKTLDYPAHLHEEVELVYIETGSTFCFAGGAEHQLRDGDFFVVFPNQVHYFRDGADVAAIIAIVPLNMLCEYGAVLRDKQPVSPLVKGRDKDAEQLMKMLAACEGKYAWAKQKGMLLAIFGMLFEKMTLIHEKEKPQTTVYEILEYCRKNFKSEISVESVAKDLHLSRSCISHIFSEKIHMNFRCYVNLLRLGEAKRLLEQGELNMTEIAAESGFSTIRTFNRVFKKQHGISPLDYRNVGSKQQKSNPTA